MLTRTLALCAALIATPATAQVEVAPLQALDFFSAGARDTGLPADLWTGSSGPVARAVIPTLGKKPLSPAAAAFGRRILSTAATGPQGAGSDIDLAAARAQALIALGDAASANSILQRAPNPQNSASLSEAAAEAALIVGDDDRACQAANALTAGRDAPYWLRLRAYCQFRAGQADAAQLTFSLANTAQRDAVYARLMGAVLAGSPPGAASLRGGLDHALSRRLGLDLSPALAGAHPAIVAQYQASTLASAADMAAVAGAPEALAKRLLAAKGVGAFTLAARSHAPLIAAMAASPATVVNPVLMARAAVAAGEVEAARAIRGAMVQDEIPGVTLTDLALLDALIATAEGRIDGPTLDRLMERGAANGAKSPAQPAALLLAALGTPMGPQARAELATFEVAKGVASPAKLTALDYAAEQGLKGETALVALSAAADAGANGPAPADRARIVRALTRVGLADDARAFAVEGLLALQVK